MYVAVYPIDTEVRAVEKERGMTTPFATPIHHHLRHAANEGEVAHSE